MNARALTGFAVVLLATMVTASPVAFGQTVQITSPSPATHISLGYGSGGATLTGGATIEFDAVVPDGVTGEVHVFVDDGAMSTYAIDADIVLTGLDAGSHTVMVWVADDSGVAYPFEPSGQGVNPSQDLTPPADTVRFYLSRVCIDDEDCLDDDPCTRNDCIGDASVGDGWYGRCRFGRELTDTDCCVAESWCLHNDLFQADGSGFMCVDVDGDSIGDCVECAMDADCPIQHSACISGVVCDEGDCVYETIGCCSNTDCNDDNNCTEDICCAGDDDPPGIGCPAAAECVTIDNGVEGCCTLDGDCDDGNHCTLDVCIGSTCAHGQPDSECCDEHADCNSVTDLNRCNDPGNSGHAACVGLGGGSLTGVCDYSFSVPGCCVYDYHCGDQYPSMLGTCINSQCDYQSNTEYCESPTDTIVINEFQVNPVGNESFPIPDAWGEWIELFNPTDIDVNVNGWSFNDLGSGGAGQLVTIDAENGRVLVPAGGYAVIARRKVSNGGLEGYVDYEHIESGFMLDNDGDEIILSNILGEVQDEVAYDASWDVQEGVAFSLINPYLDNSQAANWAHAKNPYPVGYITDEEGNPKNFGSPRLVNSDVFNTSITPPGGICNDSNPCTVDICNHDKASLCSHIRLDGCCTQANDPVCNDYNACTVDSCAVTSNTCINASVENCCAVNSDCNSWYPEWVLPGEQADFDTCALKACIGTTCRYGRRSVERPGCCLSGDHQYFGCEDRNLCTVDACTFDAGTDSYGNPYPACVFNLDLDGDTVNDCCRVDEECEDNRLATLDYCNFDFNLGGVNECQYPPDMDYCGTGGNPTCDDGDICTDDVCCTGEGSPEEGCEAEDRCLHIPVPECCATDTDCIDGQACTQDVCCTGSGAPDDACMRANSCAHPEVAAGCCTIHDDCNVAETNPFSPCRRGYCIGAVCRFGPQIDGCCTTVDDCDPGICDDVECDAGNNCVYAPKTGCCLTGGDCDQTLAPGSCEANVCISNECTVINLPNCCADDNPAGPDDSCDDGNPCTGDYCTEAGGNFQCRYIPTGGLGCCNADSMCPDDNVECTAETCEMGENKCQLDPVSQCRAMLVYDMTFTEGHSAYAGEYIALSDLAWTIVDIGSGDASAYLGFGSTGDLGPDRYLSFAPTGTVANFETCAVLPKLRTTGYSRAAIGFDFAADWEEYTAHMVLRGSTDGDWANAPALPDGGSLTVTQDIPGQHYNVDIPQSLLGTDDTMVAFCFTAPSTDYVSELMIDQIVVSQGRAPSWLDVTEGNVLASVEVAAGGNATFPAEFSVRELDTDEAVSFRVVSAPGSWVRVTNAQRASDDPSKVVADLEIVGAVCPSAGDTHDLKIEATDGALYDEAFLTLTITNCP